MQLIAGAASVPCPSVQRGQCLPLSVPRNTHTEQQLPNGMQPHRQASQAPSPSSLFISASLASIDLPSVMWYTAALLRPAGRE